MGRMGTGYEDFDEELSRTGFRDGNVVDLDGCVGRYDGFLHLVSWSACITSHLHSASGSVIYPRLPCDQFGRL